MFANLGFEHILVLLAVGLVVFGPDQLPKLVGDASRMIKQLREMASGTVDDIKSELGPEFASLDVRDLHPRRIVGQTLLGEDGSIASLIGMSGADISLGPEQAAAAAMTTPVATGAAPAGVDLPAPPPVDPSAPVDDEAT
jgi:sec-independent protein translocase protein TatB